MASNKNSLPPPFAPSRPSTRTKNKDVRPGAVDMPKTRRTPAEMQAIREQQAFDKEGNKRKAEEAMKKSAEIEDEQRQEDLKRTGESTLRKPPQARFRPPVPTSTKSVDAEIESTHTKNLDLRMILIL
jgi:hypothetical protein